MVNGESLTSRLRAAILAGKAVTLKDVAPIQRDDLPWNFVVALQRHHFWHAHVKTRGADAWLAPLRLYGNPVFPVVDLIVHGIDNSCNVIPNLDKRTGNGCDPNWLPVCVEHQCGLFKYTADHNVSVE